MTLQLAVLASGNGGNLQAIIDHISRGTLDASLRVVLCNREDAYALTRARKAGITAISLDHRSYATREAFDEAMVRCLQDNGADTVALAGFMRMLSPVFLEAFPQRVLNIHPAILPAFPGVHGAADARNWGVTITGCTVHFVDAIMDHGEVIVQAAVPANPGESLEVLQNRIHAMEHRLYPQALAWLAQNRLCVADRVVRLAPSDRKRAPAPVDALVWPPLEEGF